MIKTILFDLDGTLLPMDQDVFVKTYLDFLAEHMQQYGYEKQKFTGAVLQGIKAMVQNDGTKTNKQAFWQQFAKSFPDYEKDLPNFDDFYENHFDKVQHSCGFNPQSRKLVKTLKQMGYNLILATNPLFPKTATQKRIKWAGLDEQDFDLVTVFENSCFCKPNLNYYKQILQNQNLDPKQCMMVGNDVGEDMIAKQLGLDVFLLTADLINRVGKDISLFANGDMDDLLEYLKSKK